jgi:O-antigen ligase
MPETPEEMGHNSIYPGDYEPVTRSRRARLWESDPAVVAEDGAWSVPPRVGPSVEEAEVEEAAEISVAPKGARTARAEPSILKRGHALSYVGLFLYTVAVFFRPYEFSPSLAWMINISFWFAIFTLLVYVPTQLSLDGKLTVRPKEVNLVLLLCLAALLSIPLALSPGQALAYFTSIFVKIVIMFIVMVNVVRTERRLKGLFFLTIAAGCLSSVTAVQDYRSGNFTVEGYRVMGKIGVYGLFGNPDDMALHLITMLPIVVALLLGSRSYINKLVLGSITLLMLAGTIFSFSRGCFLGLLALTAVMAWKLGRRNKPAVLVMLFLAVMFFLALAPGHFATRILSIFDHSLDPVGSASARQNILLRSIWVALRHPLLGVGMGCFPIASIRNLGTHNAYTQVAAELGLPALAVYVGFMVYPIKRLYRIERETFDARRSSRFYYLAVGLQASLVAYMVASTFYTVAFNWNVYYLVAYAVCLRRMYESSSATAAATSATVKGTAAARAVDDDGRTVRESRRTLAGFDAPDEKRLT